MASLYLNDILQRNGLDPKRVKLLRHSLRHDRCRFCYVSGFFDEYQKIQKENLYNGCDYILSFINEPGTSAKFIGCYSVGKGVPIDQVKMPTGFPVPDMFTEGDYYFNLEPSEIMADLKEKLIIDWGKSTVTWAQWATNEKAIIAIQQNSKFSFAGYENVILNYNELKTIVNDKILYENWHTALSSVYAIYLIVDLVNGKQYVGSAYSSGGLLERWRCYVNTGHGGNIGIKETLCQDTKRYQYFQFSILQILPKTITDEEVISLESLYKNKLRSKEFGMNRN